MRRSASVTNLQQHADAGQHNVACYSVKRMAAEWRLFAFAMGGGAAESHEAPSRQPMRLSSGYYRSTT